MPCFGGNTRHLSSAERNEQEGANESVQVFEFDAGSDWEPVEGHEQQDDGAVLSYS